MKILKYTRSMNPATFVPEYSVTVMFDADELCDLRMLSEGVREEMYKEFGKTIIDEVLRPLVQGT